MYFPSLPIDARRVVLRFLDLMRRSKSPATEINSQMIHLLSTVTPGMLPSSWAGRIPPVTFQGRHKKLDKYVLNLKKPQNNPHPTFIDVGCGFPPVTTVDTANTLPDWRVYGVDRSFFRYVVYDAENHYACFNRYGQFQYYQSSAKPLDETPEIVRERFRSLFIELCAGMNAPHEHDSEAVEKDGCKLITNHIRNFESENLTFLKSDLEELDLPPADFIRCMNMLLYFDDGMRKTMNEHLARLLEENGLLMTGFNHPFGIYARYTVYRKNGGGTRPVEFAFSLDNLKPLGIGPWMTIADNDREAELLADLSAAIRSDNDFWPQFNRRVDILREKTGLCVRDDKGFLCFTNEGKTAHPFTVMSKMKELWQMMDGEGCTDGAVKALSKAGFTAWKNHVGDVAVLPPEGLLYML